VAESSASFAIVEELIQRADEKLTRAKKEGKNRFCFNNLHLRKFQKIK